MSYYVNNKGEICQAFKYTNNKEIILKIKSLLKNGVTFTKVNNYNAMIYNSDIYYEGSYLVKFLNGKIDVYSNLDFKMDFIKLKSKDLNKIQNKTHQNL